MQSVNDFKLTQGSPLIDGTDADKKINFDFSWLQRPSGVKSDIGAFEYDVTTLVETQHSLPDNQIKLLQNPVKDLLEFSLPKNSNSEINLKIYNLIGKMIIELKLQKLPTENSIVQANISKIASGMYIFTIRSGENACSGKFLKR